MGVVVKIVYHTLAGLIGGSLALAAGVATGVAVYYVTGKCFGIIPKEMIELCIRKLKGIVA